MNLEELTTYLLRICKENNYRKIYICGNGSSGKTTLSKSLYNKASTIGLCNLISLDDYLVDLNLRKNSTYTWYENDKKYQGRYTSSYKETYDLKSVYALLYNLDNGLDSYYFPLRYQEKHNIRRLYANYTLTILEGVGTIFLDKDTKESLTILLECSKYLEIKRRSNRTKELKRDISENFDEVRAREYQVNVLSQKETFDLIINSDEDYKYHLVGGKLFKNNS
mgnify:CR=1 FL=1